VSNALVRGVEDCSELLPIGSCQIVQGQCLDIGHILRLLEPARGPSERIVAIIRGADTPRWRVACTLHAFIIIMATLSDKRILVIEDSPVYRHLITSHLREWGFEMVVAKSGEEGWEILERGDSPKLALMDWVMPGMDGAQICRRLRQRNASDSYVYSILLTSRDSRADLMKALEAGADDYLAKPFDEHELKARLLVGMRIVGLQEELIAARERMRYDATRDSLTGLLNRREILESLGRELARSRRERQSLSVMMVDIDHFKRVNDELGHNAGDQVLKEVAKRLRLKLRVYDGIGRYGGEEFLLILSGCDLTSALIRADEIRSAVSSTAVTALKTPRRITLSMGLAVAEGDSTIEMDALLHQADCALYKAKNSGRDQIQSVQCSTEVVVEL
jgi:diguanylate cyclase (GGDEF)-like protein